MNKIQKFFSQTWLMIVAPILFFIGTIGTDIYLFFGDDYKDGIYYLGGDIFVATITLIACLSFAKHNKNVLKALIGGLLFYTVTENIVEASYYIFFAKDLTDSLISSSMAVLSIILFVNHLILATNHKSSKVAIKINLITVLLYILVTIGWEIYNILFYDTTILYAILWSLYNFGLVVLIVNIESKIDYFKQQRDEREKAAEFV